MVRKGREGKRREGERSGGKGRDMEGQGRKIKNKNSAIHFKVLCKPWIKKTTLY